MAVVYSVKQKPIGKIWPHPSGSIAAATNGRRNPIGLFTSTALAIAALMDCSDWPLEEETWLIWVELLIEEPADEIVVTGAVTNQQPSIGQETELIFSPW